MHAQWEFELTEEARKFFGELPDATTQRRITETLKHVGLTSRSPITVETERGPYGKVAFVKVGRDGRDWMRLNRSFRALYVSHRAHI